MNVLHNILHQKYNRIEIRIEPPDLHSKGGFIEGRFTFLFEKNTHSIRQHNNVAIKIERSPLLAHVTMRHACNAT